MNPQLIQKLCDASVRLEVSPYHDFLWPDSLNPEEDWFMSPTLISIYGTPTFEGLSVREQKKLSFFECINFFSLNIHGERPLIQGLADRFYKDRFSDVVGYLHHFLDEENDHMVYFGTFCQKYAGKIYRDKKISFPRDYEVGEEDFLFFAKVMIFEEIVDFYNISMSKDESLHPTVREINRRHHLDEARHLVFGRQMVKDLFEYYSTRWNPETLFRVRQYLEDYLVATWREYVNPEVYEDVGLPNAYDLADRFYDRPEARSHRLKVSQACIKFLRDHEILLKEPESLLRPAL